MTIEILPLSHEDIDEVVQLGEATPEFRTGTDTPNFYGRETLLKWVSSPNGATFAAKDEKGLLGFILGSAMGGSRDAYINCTVVTPESRGQGIGTMLTRAVEEKFAQLGCNHVFSVIREDNLAMLGLKRNLGYQVGGEHMLYVDKMIEPPES